MMSSSLAESSISNLVELISSSAIAPGAGAAGAVALALAAACAGKAVAISLKHSDDVRLHRALGRFQALSRHALQEADNDAEAFAAWVRDRGAAATDELIESEERAACLINALLVTLDEIEPCIRANMLGDLKAAKSLAGAAKAIQMANENEAKGARGRG